MPRHYRKYTDEDVLYAVQSSTSIRQVLSKLGLKEAGGNYQCIRLLIQKLGLDTSHFTGKGWLRNKTHNYRKRNIQEILVYGKFENNNDLKPRLYKENIKEEKCEECGLTDWLGRKISLQLHHKDGDRLNNTLANLQILCPNCHSLTDNYAGKSKGKYKEAS